MEIDRAVINLIRVLQVVVEVVKDIVEVLEKAIPRERGPKGPQKKGPRKGERIMTTAPEQTKRRRGSSTL